ncbi:MAG: hypothetical protein ACTHU0_28770 [Kofleriaceae bacterium]
MTAPEPAPCPSCLFCSVPAREDVLEHVLSESLGGEDERDGVRGLVCLGCNNYFGAKVEKVALASFPFSVFRVMNCIVTKKGRPARLDDALQGRLFSTPRRNVLEIEPRNETFRQGLLDERITQMRILAEIRVRDAIAICRLLLKMGCEHLATFDPVAARGDRLAAARAFARAPKRGATWWFLLRSDPSRFGQMDDTFLDVVEEQGALMVHFHSACFDIVAPMTEDIEPASELDAPPASTLYRVTI